MIFPKSILWSTEHGKLMGNLIFIFEFPGTIMVLSLATSDLLKIYDKLDPLLKRIIQVAALYYLPAPNPKYFYYSSEISRLHSELHKNLIAQLAKENNGKPIGANNFTILVKTLAKHKLLTNEFYCPTELIHPLCKIAAQKDNIAVNLPIILTKTQFNILPKFNHSRKFDLYDKATISEDDLRCLNLAIHINSNEIFEQVWSQTQQLEILTLFRLLFLHVQLEDSWVKSRLMIFQQILCVIKLSSDLGYNTDPVAERQYWINHLLSLPHENQENFPLINVQLAQLNITYGNVAMKSTNNNLIWAQHFSDAKNALLANSNTTALKLFDLSIREFGEIANRNHWYWLIDATILYLICLIREQKFSKLDLVISRLDKLLPFRQITIILVGINALINNDRSMAEDCLKKLDGMILNTDILTARILLTHALYNWLSSLIAPQKINWDSVLHYFKLSMQFHAPLVTTIYAELILKNKANDTNATKFLSTSPYCGLNITQLIHVKAEWEYTVDKLAMLLNNTEALATQVADQRLIWLLDPQSGLVNVVEQKRLKNGQWNVGKTIPISRLTRRDDFAYATVHDIKVMDAIESDAYRRSGSYMWNKDKLILSLIGHPHVFDYHNPNIQLELILDHPELQIKTIQSGYRVTLSHLAKHPSIEVEKISTSKYRIVEYNEQMIQLCELINKGIDIPLSAKDRLMELVCNTTPDIKITTDIVDKNLPAVDANSTCHIQLTPNGNEGLIANLFMRPFGIKSSYYLPAQGLGSQVTPDEHGKPTKLVRQFKQETKQCQQLLGQCPILSTSQTSKFEWIYDDLEQSLQLLSELNACKDTITIEWPKGESLKFKTNLSAQNLHLQIKSQQQWFEYEGEVQIDANEVLSLKALLDLLDTNSSSRFVQLNNGQFIALTESFKQQLAELKMLSDKNKVFHLGSGILDSLTNDAKTAAVDKKWREHIKAISNRRQFTPKLPSTLQAELRDYQLEGFNYLSRLTNWQIGACLADDMGLGKTVQAISLLLEQAQNGASLVIAPTSVCFNWVEELNKFAPSLNSYLLHNENQRNQRIEQVGPGDVLICSYTLLQYESSLLTSKEWNLLILDEAQNIKNHTTKRFKAACELNAKRRVALSGTPIENHLGELWSLFKFLNPGLLGSLDNFQKKFITPISNKNHLAKQALKNLIYPYILRRNKAQVLNELPAKIEQSIFVEPSSEEIAFYEAIRQKALDNIKLLSNANNNRFSILAEITRLRQACCHSSLVDKNIHLENSKLALFLELVEDLIENKHKVLVFSQYIGYLGIVKQTLAKHKIAYQYLDGSCSTQMRKAAVDAFQSGNGGDVFLISLKAGGTGLNLTAADYVIILDPWWNPAVEDQAADRAHRMGQKRPVTVYRLIMKNSIEEKIVHLHKDKRDLAGDLLSGQEVSGTLSSEDLINLIQV